jgi:predicted nucleic acid-binding protein
MTLASISNGTSVFVDANTFVYHLEPDPVFGPPCRQFFDRIDRQEILAITSSHEVSNAAHRLMTLEAMALFGWPATGIAQRLRRHPQEIQRLTNFRAAVEEVYNSKVRFLSVTAALVVSAATLSQQFGLLSGDALIVAMMQGNGLTHLASNDADFDHVPGLTRYAPA